MFVTKLKIAAVMLFVATVIAAGGLLSHGLTAAPQPEAKANGDDKDAKPIAVNVVKPKQSGFVRTVRFPGEIVASQQQQVGPLVSGIIKEVLVDIGDRVKKGQVLVVLDAPLLAKEVEEAMASLELAQAQIEEIKEIVEIEKRKSEAAQPNNLMKVRASLKPALARVKLAQTLLDKARIRQSYTRLHAAFDGVVMRRTIDPGNFVQASDSRLLQPLLTVQRLDPVRVVVEVSTWVAPSIKREMPVEVEMPWVHGREYKINRFRPSLDGGDRKMTVEIDVANEDNRLVPGMTGKVNFQLKKSDGLLVPSSCVLGHRGQLYVYMVRDGKAKRMPIVVSIDTGKEAEITKGITASDLIVVSNQGKLEEGTPVKVDAIKEP